MGNLRAEGIHQSSVFNRTAFISLWSRLIADSKLTSFSLICSISTQVSPRFRSTLLLLFLDAQLNSIMAFFLRMGAMAWPCCTFTFTWISRFTWASGSHGVISKACPLSFWKQYFLSLRQVEMALVLRRSQEFFLPYKNSSFFIRRSCRICSLLSSLTCDETSSGRRLSFEHCRCKSLSFLHFQTALWKSSKQQLSIFCFEMRWLWVLSFCLAICFLERSASGAIMGAGSASQVAAYSIQDEQLQKQKYSRLHYQKLASIEKACCQMCCWPRVICWTFCKISSRRSITAVLESICRSEQVRWWKEKVFLE